MARKELILLLKSLIILSSNFFKMYLLFSRFLNQVRDRPARAWFLKIDPVQIVSMCVCLHVCVSTPEAINN